MVIVYVSISSRRWRTGRGGRLNLPFFRGVAGGPLPLSSGITSEPLMIMFLWVRACGFLLSFWANQGSSMAK